MRVGGSSDEYVENWDFTFFVYICRGNSKLIIYVLRIPYVLHLPKSLKCPTQERMIALNWSSDLMSNADTNSPIKYYEGTKVL